MAPRKGNNRNASSSRGKSASSRKTGRGRRRRPTMSPVTMTLATTGLLGLIGGLIWMMTRPKIAYAPTSGDYVPDNPIHDVFGNTGEENMVEPLTLREDEENMSDRMNPHPGLI